MKKVVVKKAVFLACPLLALILEILPYGAVLNFMLPPESGSTALRQTYSYFNFITFGYANFGPVITAMLTCVLLVLGIVYAFTARGQLAIRAVGVAAAAASFLPLLMYGSDYYSLVGGLISTSLCLGVVAAFAFRRKKAPADAKSVQAA